MVSGIYIVFLPQAICTQPDLFALVSILSCRPARTAQWDETSGEFAQILLWNIFKFHWKVNKSLSLKSYLLCCQKTLAISISPIFRAVRGQYQQLQTSLGQVEYHAYHGQFSEISLVHQCLLPPCHSVTLPYILWAPGRCLERMGHSRLASPLQSRVLQRLPVQPALSWLQICLQLNSVWVQAFSEPAWGFLTVQHGALQLLPSEKLQTVVVNRYSLSSCSQEKEVL